MKIKDKSTAEQESAAREDQLALLAGAEPASSHIGARLRGYFLTGLIVVGPVAITLYVVWWFINLVDAWVKPLLPQAYLPDTYLPFEFSPASSTARDCEERQQQTSCAEHLYHDNTNLNHTATSLSWPTTRSIGRMLKKSLSRTV